MLEERYPFAVPRYQRAYAWEDEAVGHFVRDIEAVLSKPSGSVSHFFGGVVCIELTDNQKVRPHSYEVVDGQQRLATFMLALSCVVEMAAELATDSNPPSLPDAKRADTLRADTAEKYVTWKEADIAAGVTEVRPRLMLSLADDAVFQGLIMPGLAVPKPSRESHQLLIDARTALLDMTRRFIGIKGAAGGRVDRLLRLRQALVQDAHIIHIVSKDRSQAYRLFSVLNHRGESLSDADLLRSRSLELLDSYASRREQVARLWDEMLASSAKNVEAFFKALYPSWTGVRAKGDLFEAIEEQFFPKMPPKTAAEAQSLVKTIELFRDELSIFLKLVAGDWPYDRPPGVPNQVRAWQVDRLRRLILTLKHELALPVLLAGAVSLSEGDFAELVYMLEVFAFRYKNVCNGHATRPANLYYSEACKMHTASHASYTLNAFRIGLRKLINDHAADALFVQLLGENLRFNNSSQRANIREFLTTIEDHRQWWTKTGSTNPKARPKPTMIKVIDIADATLEHIYPQRAEPADKDSALEPLKHNLGNITFFGQADNVAAANKSFAAKQAAYYAISSIGMTSDLATKAAWTEADLSQREQELVAMAVRVFVV
ncbi:DUF262 domain-containing protein [Dactylosporangium cerinum]|uniref:DUF262 domain-containing protein n=1 Tax=Dactylosporangium cerinum TaxID=1434730 RepID=A0ABV9VUC0_9ACTN